MTPTCLGRGLTPCYLSRLCFVVSVHDQGHEIFTIPLHLILVCIFVREVRDVNALTAY